MSDPAQLKPPVNPMVSVVMPCYNDGATIGEAVASALNQTYPYLEVVVVDDGSTDPATQAWFAGPKDARVRTLSTHHLGPSQARNAAIEAAAGAYILPLDSDDTIEPTYVEKAVALLEARPQVGVVYCQADLFGASKGRWDLLDYSLENMLVDNMVFVTALFRRAHWVDIGGFSPELKDGMEDYDFWLSFLERDLEIVQIPEVLFHYRIKEASRTTRFSQDLKTMQATYRTLYQRHLPLYHRYQDLYAMALRDAFIDQIFINRSLRKTLAIFSVFDRFTLLKKIAKKLLKRG